MPGVITGAFDFVVSGDNPDGAQVVYLSSGLSVPLVKPWPIILYGLKAEFKAIASGNQLIGVMAFLYGVITRNGAQVFLASVCTGPFDKLLSWDGELPLGWGFGISTPNTAGLTAAHKLVISAQYRLVE